MFRIRTYLTNACVGSFDLAIVAVCHLAAWQMDLNPAPGSTASLISGRLLSLGVAAILWIAFSTYFRLYHSRRLDSPFADMVTLLKINLGSWLALEGVAHLLPQTAPSPVFLLRFAALNTLALTAARPALRLAARELRRRGHNVKKVVLVATPELGDRVAQKIEQRAHLGYRIVRRLPEAGVNPDAWPRLVEQLQQALESSAAEDVIIALPASANNLTTQLAAECESWGVNVRIVPDLLPLIQSDTQVYDLDGIPLVNVRRYPTECLRYVVLKRIFDVAASLVFLVLFTPIYVIIAGLVKLSSRGPVHFVQERVGLNGKKFKILKFRTMRADRAGTEWNVPNDHPHITAVGRFLRISSLDEVPQFLNVLKGDMSIVGPRPERPAFLEGFRRQVPEYMARHYVKSGITGWAQVNGWRGDTSISQRVACDLYYIRNWAFVLDLKIVLLTVLRTFFHRNAY